MNWILLQIYTLLQLLANFKYVQDLLEKLVAVVVNCATSRLETLKGDFRLPVRDARIASDVDFGSVVHFSGLPWNDFSFVDDSNCVRLDIFKKHSRIPDQKLLVRDLIAE